MFHSINGDRYEGDFSFNKRHGKGRLWYDNGNEYTGEFSNHKLNGQGTLVMKSDRMSYTGEFVNNEFHGKGVLTFNLKQPNEYQYKGNFDHGLRNGEGEICFTLDTNIQPPPLPAAPPQQQQQQQKDQQLQPPRPQSSSNNELFKKTTYKYQGQWANDKATQLPTHIRCLVCEDKVYVVYECCNIND